MKKRMGCFAVLILLLASCVLVSCGGGGGEKITEDAFDKALLFEITPTKLTQTGSEGSTDIEITVKSAIQAEVIGYKQLLSRFEFSDFSFKDGYYTHTEEGMENATHKLAFKDGNVVEYIEEYTDYTEQTIVTTTKFFY